MGSEDSITITSKELKKLELNEPEGKGDHEKIARRIIDNKEHEKDLVTCKKT